MSTEIEQLRRDIEALKRTVATMPPIGDVRDFVVERTRAEAAYQSIGDSAPQPLNGETLSVFRRRCIAGVQHLSPRWRGVPIDGINDPAALTAIGDDVYSDAPRAAASPEHFRPGEMRAIIRADGAGRPITRYVGHPSACWDQFNPAFRYVRGGVNGFTAPKIGSR